LGNFFTERLSRCVKYETAYLNEYAARRDALRGISPYFAFYNAERPHQSIDRLLKSQLNSTPGVAAADTTLVIHNFHSFHSAAAAVIYKIAKDHPP
jgi:hypothetical protein